MITILQYANSLLPQSLYVI